MKLIRPSSTITEHVTTQQSDGLELLRKVPLIRRFVPPNLHPFQSFAGRVSFSDCVIDSETSLNMGHVYEQVFGDTLYHFIPVVRNVNRYECKVIFLQRQ